MTVLDFKNVNESKRKMSTSGVIGLLQKFDSVISDVGLHVYSTVDKNYQRRKLQSTCRETVDSGNFDKRVRFLFAFRSNSDRKKSVVQVIHNDTIRD